MLAILSELTKSVCPEISLLRIVFACSIVMVVKFSDGGILCPYPMVALPAMSAYAVSTRPSKIFSCSVHWKVKFVIVYATAFLIVEEDTSFRPIMIITARITTDTIITT